MMQKALERRSIKGITEVEIPADLEWFWNAFWMLHLGRSGGFGPNPIALSEMLAYLNLHHITDSEFRQDFVTYIRAMDIAYLKWYAEKSKNDGGCDRNLRSGNRRAAGSKRREAGIKGH